MKLYHFTKLLALPAILREGIIYGEVPLEGMPYKDIPHAPNLTRNPKPEDQSCWNGGGRVIGDKSKVRLTVELGENEIVSFRTVQKRLRMRSSWVKTLAPASQHYDWYFALAPVPPERVVKVEVTLHRRNEYVELIGDDIASLIARIEADDPKLTFAYRKYGTYATNLTHELIHNCWLIDGLRFKPVPIPETSSRPI